MKPSTRPSRLRTALLSAAALLPVTNVAQADEIYTPVLSPVTPSAGSIVPPVARVPGKEFTDSLDMDYQPTPHSAQPTQIGLFDGLGGAQNGLTLGALQGELDEFNIDAQSQLRDRLFHEVVANRTPLIVSTSFDQMLGADVALSAETPDGSVQPFATRSQVVNHPHAGGTLRDIDSVDLWGPEGKPRASFYSFENEPGDVSVYTLQTLAPGFVLPYLTTSDIAGALGNPDLAPLIDVDAVMVDDVGTGINPFDGEFGPGDSVLFSIAPIPNPEGGLDFFDGGEIWHWEHGKPAEFLVHGGHRWDTAFDVQGTFGVQTENIDALEAAGVPEPGAAVISLVGMVLLSASGRRGRSVL